MIEPASGCGDQRRGGSHLRQGVVISDAGDSHLRQGVLISGGGNPHLREGVLINGNAQPRGTSWPITSETSALVTAPSRRIRGDFPVRSTMVLATGSPLGPPSR